MIRLPDVYDNYNKYIYVNGRWEVLNSGGGGSRNYEQLSNKPKINNVELIGNKTGSDLGLLSENDALTNEQLNNLISLL